MPCLEASRPALKTLLSYFYFLTLDRRFQVFIKYFFQIYSVILIYSITQQLSAYFRASRTLKQTINTVVSACIEVSGVTYFPCFIINVNKDNICMARSRKGNRNTVFNSCFFHPLPLQKTEFDSSCILDCTGELTCFFSAEVANCNKLYSVL